MVSDQLSDDEYDRMRDASIDHMNIDTKNLSTIAIYHDDDGSFGVEFDVSKQSVVFVEDLDG